ncbi:MAG TPA: acyltransferase, partial [Candidatus Acidoferrales bacterium]|nr:acyltransferase [Candidatus Acidoferrales bacterium]
MRYRADIDGLRAVAVLSVLGFHLRIGMFRGGFVGVDIFFVISGYLIGSIILHDLAAGRFSFGRFYERRVRRIIPALLAALAVTAVLAYVYFLPGELVAFAKSLLAAVLSASNFYFWTQSSYFSAPAEMKPLLHTWSLGVEEQFYVCLPIFLFLAHRYFPRRLRLSVVLVALASFVLSAVGAFRAPASTFYLLHTRAWELLVGVLIALEVFPEISSPLARNLAAGGGLALISASVLRYSPALPFPGIAALAPCAGAALVILSGRTGTSAVGRLLSLRPVVFVGLISYSLYLWHWPIIVFQGMESVTASGLSARAAKLISIAVSFAVATLSWKFVEMPFRQSGVRLSRPALFKLASTAAALVAAIGLATILSGGMPSRYPSNAIRVAAYVDYDSAGYF